MLKLAGLALSVLLLSVTGFLPYVDAQIQTKYLTYQNQQYGFSIKHPSNWEKTVELTQSKIFSNMLDIVTFSTPSGFTNYGVSLIQDDTTYRGLSGQKFLDKIKKDYADSFCSKVPAGLTCSTELFQLTTLTHQNGYTGYLIIFGINLSSNQGSSESTIVLGFYPNGNDIWTIGVGTSSNEDFQQYTDELNAIGDSFTISNYTGEQTTTQPSLVAKSSVGTLQINSGYFTASQYKPAELIVSGQINDHLQGVPLTIKITKPNKSSDEQKILVTKDGAFRAPIKIDGTWPAGSYQITANYGTQDLGAVSFLVNMGSAPPPTLTPAQTTTYLTYQNKQYGFTIKYPSGWQKEEVLEKDDESFPNMFKVVTFSTPSELTNFAVNILQDDTTYRGLSGQKFLDKMKNEFKRSLCSAVADAETTCSMEAFQEESYTNEKGYNGYRAAYIFTISDGQDPFKVLVAPIMYPNGNDVWMLVVGSFSGDELQNLSKELDEMDLSFTINNYQVAKKQFSLESKAAQKNNIVYIVIKNPKDSTDEIYGIKLTNTNGKITNFIKVKGWDYVRLGSGSVMYQTTTSPLDSSDIIKMALKVDSKNTEIQWEAFSKDQKSIGTGKVKTS